MGEIGVVEVQSGDEVEGVKVEGISIAGQVFLNHMGLQYRCYPEFEGKVWTRNCSWFLKRMCCRRRA